MCVKLQAGGEQGAAGGGQRPSVTHLPQMVTPRHPAAATLATSCPCTLNPRQAYLALLGQVHRLFVCCPLFVGGEDPVFSSFKAPLWIPESVKRTYVIKLCVFFLCSVISL